MRKTICWTAMAAALCLAATPAPAQDAATGEKHKEMAAEGREHAAHPAAAAAPAAMPADAVLKKAILGTYDFETNKLTSLAEAFPADKYGWRPADGVRSVSEAFMHVASANYFLSGALGAAMPEGAGPDMEKETDKAKVVAALKASIAHARAAIDATALADLGTEIEVFGQKMTKAQVVLILVGHAEEHLGQEIAYARSTGVVPPWSQPEPPPAAAGAAGASGR